MNLPTVSEGQIVAAVLRSVATQLIKLAERLDTEAAANRPAPPPKKRGKVESLREMCKRKGML